MRNPTLEDAPIDARLSVNEVLRRRPRAVRVLNAFGIDTCCGGAASLDEAAREVGVPVDDLVLAVEMAETREGA